jgi:hypothetical protein
MHHGLIKTLRSIVEDSGVPEASIVEDTGTWDLDI